MELTLAEAVERYLDILDRGTEFDFNTRQILKRESLADVRAALEREKVSHES